jgi:hypothetical protein
MYHTLAAARRRRHFQEVQADLAARIARFKIARVHASAQWQQLHLSQAQSSQDGAAAAALSFSLFPFLSLFLPFPLSQSSAAAAARFTQVLKVQQRWQQQQSVQECASAYHRGSGSSSQSQCAAAYHRGSSSSSSNLFADARRAPCCECRGSCVSFFPKRRPTSGEGLSRARNRQCEPPLGHAARAAKCEPPLGHAARLQRARRANNRHCQQVSNTLTCSASPALAHNKARRRQPLTETCGSCVRRQNRTKQTLAEGAASDSRGTCERLT